MRDFYSQSSPVARRSIELSMKTSLIPSLVLAVALLSFSVPVPALAADGGFDKFCRTWMKKLEDRETFNQKQASVKSRGGEFVIEYTGYSRKPTSCTSSRSRGNALIGTLVYEEIRYQKTGAKRASVTKGHAVEVKRAPVTEIFGHDGKEWLY